MPSPTDVWAEIATFTTPLIRSRNQSRSQPWGFMGLDPGPQAPIAFDWLERAPYLQITKDEAEAETTLFWDNSRLDPPLADRMLGLVTPCETAALNNTLFSPNLQQAQLLSAWSHLIAPRNTPGMLQVTQHHARWLAHLPPLTGASPLLDTAVRAVTLAHLGRVHSSNTLIIASHPYYGKALRPTQHCAPRS